MPRWIQDKEVAGKGIKKLAIKVNTIEVLLITVSIGLVELDIKETLF